ncbi:MAG: hypothetical protein LUH23_03180 [Oscillospiraceae bacterium]|nr:hypothetical protein [Oscillospiraceae bacterium]
MTESKAKTGLALSVVAVTKYLMERYSISHEEAYRKLTSTDFFEKLNDIETGLYLETTDYLCRACTLELETGKDAMYEFINGE